MDSMPLGRLEKIDLREVWDKEDQDFTPWLAQEDNLAVLGDALGLELELEGREEMIGIFSADMVCRDTVTDGFVVVENQLERTDHTHLGQLITYGAGSDGITTVVWIARQFTDEHRAAMDWLNEITGEDISFFGLEVEVWRIGNSPAAPKFNVVSKPNEWTKGSRGAPPGQLTDMGRLQLAYWTQFREYLQDTGSFLRTRKPRAQNWTSFAIGRVGFSLDANVHAKEMHACVSLVLKDSYAKDHFRALSNAKTSVETEVGSPLQWYELPDKKWSYISLYKRDTDPSDRDQWSEQHQWLKDNLETFHRAFAPRISALGREHERVEDEEEYGERPDGPVN